MGFTPVKTDGNWASMRDLAKIGDALTLRKGFLIDDDTNVYQGESAPRFIVKSTSQDGEEIQTGVAKGYSRDLNLVGAAKYLDEAPEGTTLEIKFVATKGAYIDVEFVGGDVELADA